MAKSKKISTTTQINVVKKISATKGSFNQLPSNIVKVYPSSRRSDYYDRNSRLTSEQNLISVVNRLTGIDSFIVDGLEIDVDNQTLKSGSCNIHGYYFKITDSIDLKTLKGSPKDNQYLFFTISTAITKANSSDVSVTYEELDVADSDWIKDANLASPTTYLDNSNNTFLGLGLEINDNTTPTIDNEGDPVTSHIYRLPIAEYMDGKWQSIMSDDTRHIKDMGWNKLKYRASDIKVEATKDIVTTKSDIYNTEYANPQDLVTWLENNFVIDDGEIN